VTIVTAGPAGAEEAARLICSRKTLARIGPKPGNGSIGEPGITGKALIARFWRYKQLGDSRANAWHPAPNRRILVPVIAVDTPVGRLGIAERDGQIVRVSWSPSPDGETIPPPEGETTPLLAEAARQMAAYFAGELTAFDLPLDPGGSALERGVFDAMRAIPYGQTRTYGDIASELGTYGQPVGQACGANPIPVIIPCHRVLSATGLGGYSGQGGIETKIALLKLEGGYPFLL
jgi:methylated-DNA-[protein]-cysteine S-methyltransferase